MERMFKSLLSLSVTDKDEIIRPAEERPDRFYIADEADAFNDYIVMDDGKLPYSKYSFSKPGGSEYLFNSEYSFDKVRIKSLTVPLSKKMYLEAIDAFGICQEFIVDDQKVFSQAFKDYFEGDARENFVDIGKRDNPLIFRLFLASSRSFRNFRVNSMESADKLKYVYMSIPFPRFIWVCELYSKKSYEKDEAIGEIVIDATSTANEKLNSIIMMQYPGVYARGIIKDETDDEHIHAYKVNGWRPFKKYGANLKSLSELA
jgi:hypothetical protein